MKEGVDFKITTGIKMLYMKDLHLIGKLFSDEDNMGEITKELNKLYNTKIKIILQIVKNVAKLGYNIFYKEE